MSRDKGNPHDAGESRDWQEDLKKDVEKLRLSIEAERESFGRQMDFYKSEIKELKEDNARWLCKHTAAEQNYLTQSNVIAELRGRAEKAEEREQKLKEAIKYEIDFLDCGSDDRLEKVLSILYPLENRK